MQETQTPSLPPRYSAFTGLRRVAQGTLAQLARALSALPDDAEPVLVFDDATGALVDAPRPGHSPADESSPAAEPAPPPAVGRPRLGVVAREVTLLPRHWDWLAAQPGGASAALRRLVDEARRTHAGRDAQRAATERAYRFMSGIAGGLPGFEEASRALFAHDAPAFKRRIAAWPPDVRTHLEALAQGAWSEEQDIDAALPPPTVRSTVRQQPDQP